MNKLWLKPQNGKTHSRFGIVSCLFHVISWILTIINGTPWYDSQGNYLYRKGFDFSDSLLIYISLLGLGFAIAGILQKNKENMFPIVGIIVNFSTIIYILL